MVVSGSLRFLPVAGSYILLGIADDMEAVYDEPIPEEEPADLDALYRELDLGPVEEEAVAA
jgi:hypothetical protein